ncbi:LPS O-antigen chain length determinant protein WzzB [Alcaligenaceae bacterium]|nr:LPS O-antigen chain length determinant protein WzzB [Alcaligenaceae bacterium]
MDKHESYPRAQNHEVDLADILCALWAGKWLILGITALISCISVAYALMATPVYETTARTLPPTASGLVSYNAASQLTGAAINGMLNTDSPEGIQTISPDDAYAAFIMQLGSNAIKEKFFETYYLPKMSKEDDASTQKLWKRLEHSVRITLPTQTDASAAVTIEGTDPRRIADWANHYVALAIDATKLVLLDNLKGEIEVRKNGVKNQISTLRVVAKESRESNIVRLQSALKIAESIGLESPQEGIPFIAIGTGTGSANPDNFASNELAYLRGAKALRSEIDQIRQRQNDDAYINELPDLIKRKALLQGITVDQQHLSVARVDSAAQAPEDPVRPRKSLIAGLGLVVGLMLGMMLVLARLMLKKA